MTGYTKLFSSLVTSTVWREPSDLRVVWITLLALADKNGVVEGSIPGLADMARVEVETCRAVLKRLQEPDEDSRTQEFDGRRIEPVDGGFRILNYAKYRAKMSADERRDYQREKQREYRQRRKRGVDTVKNAGNVSGTRAQGRHIAEAEAEAEADTEAKARTARARASETFSVSDNTLHAWISRWETRWPGEIARVTPAQIATLRGHAKHYGHDELVARMDRYFASTDRWLVEHKHPLGRFVNGIAQYGEPEPVVSPMDQALANARKKRGLA